MKKPMPLTQRHLMLAAVVCVLGLSVSTTRAQDQASPQVPEKILDYLGRLVGTWSVQAYWGDEVGTGTMTAQWHPSKQYVIAAHTWDTPEGKLMSDTMLFGWDGLSPDGFIMYRLSVSGFHCLSRGKIVSETVVESVNEGVSEGQAYTDMSRSVMEGPDRFVYTSSMTVEGQTQVVWKGVYTRLKTTSDEQELIRLQQEWSRAEVAGDVAALDRLLADEYVLTLPDGTLLPKAEYLHDVESEETRSIAMTVENSKVRLYGDMALVKGIVKWTEPGGKKHEDLYSETWLKRDGRWQCLGTQESEIKSSMVDAPALSPEMKKLEGFVGEWTYEGEQMDPPVEGLPFGQAGTFSGKSTVRFVLDGAFQERRFEDDAPLTANGIGLLGYDPQKKCYMNHGYVNDGSQSISTYTLDGYILKIDSVTTTSKGDKVPVRYVSEYASDWSSSTTTVEVSPDNGKTWKLWWKERAKKVKD